MNNLKITKIHRWHQEFEWLSNNYLSQIRFEGDPYPSVTHAFIASRTKDQTIRNKVTKAKFSELPDLLRKMGTPHSGWHQNTVMKELLEVKFGLFPGGSPLEFKVPMKLLKQLIQTGSAQLVYGNYDHDMMWGQCLCNTEDCKDYVGKNLLGFIIMSIRDRINKRIELFASTHGDWCFCGAAAQHAILYTKGWTPSLKSYCDNITCVKRVAELLPEMSSDGIWFEYPPDGSMPAKFSPLPIKPVNEVIKPKIEVVTVEDEDFDLCDTNGYNEFGTWMGLGMAQKSTTSTIERKYETLTIQGK